MEQRQTYLKALESTVDTIGWRLILEDVEKQIEAARLALDGVTDLRALGVLQGRIGAFQEILTLEQHIKVQLEELELDADV